MTKAFVRLSTALILCAAAWCSAPSVAAAGHQHLESTIAFSSNRDQLDLVLPAGAPASLRFEVYLMNPDGTSTRRLTANEDSDGFAALSPNGKTIAFDSNRNRPAPGTLIDANGTPCPIAPGGAFDPSYVVSDLFLMNTDGSDQRLLRARSTSATWSPNGKRVAFHASASGTGCPTRSDPGAGATDSDIFVAKVKDLLKGRPPRNITHHVHPDKIDDDADWSATGQIVYTAHDAGDDIQNPAGTGAVSNSAELYVTDPDGREHVRLTDNDYEERAASWSPDGDTLVYSCRIGGGFADFELCVIDGHKHPDGTLPTPTVLTDNSVPDLTATFSPDGQQIVFQRVVPGQGNQLFTMPPRLNPDGTLPTATQITFFPNGDGMQLLPNWGELRVKDKPHTE
jgi:Tol biopolymer transport system component